MRLGIEFFKVCFLIRPFASPTPNVTMPLVQLLRSRVQFAIPLLRQSIRVGTSSGPIRPRCFVTTLPRAQEVETDATTTATAEAIEETAAVGTSGEDSVRIDISKPPSLVFSPKPKPSITGFVIRKVDSTRTGPGTVAKTLPRINVIRSHTNALDQGYSIVRISKFISVLRDPTVTLLGAAIVRRISLNPDNSMTSRTFLIHSSDVLREREFMRGPANSTQSPIMEKLKITSIEDDRHRYIVENLRDVGLGAANSLNVQVKSLIDRWQRVKFFATRRLAENIEAIQKAPKGTNVIYEWQTGQLLSLPAVEALDKAVTEHQYLIHAIRRAAGVPDRGFIGHILPWSPDLFTDIIRNFKKAERQASAILKRPPGALMATVIGEDSRYELPVEEVLEKFSNTGNAILQKTKTLIDCCIAGEPDLHSIRLTNMRKADKKIMNNLKSLRKYPTEDRVSINTMTGGKSHLRSDAIRVVEDQINRNIRIITSILSEMGIPPTVANQPAPGTLKLPIRRYGFSIFPGNRRAFSTAASRSRQQSRSRSPSRYNLRRSLPEGSSPRLNWGKKAPEAPPQLWPKPAPGDSVRDKMAEKEKERFETMSGLTYSLLPGDRQEGGSASVQAVVEKESFQDVGMWESGSDEAGVLTDESGIEPLRKGDLCEIR